MVEYGLIGLAVAAVLIAGLQFRPQNIFPSQGTLQIGLTDSAPVVDLPSAASSCHANCTVTSLNVTITAIEVHTSGINNMTGEWTPVCTQQVPMTFDIVKLKNVTQILCGATFHPDTITNVRLSISAVSAAIQKMGVQSLGLPSGKLEIPLSPGADIHAGKTTTVTVDFQPHVVCQGNSECRLTPVLHAWTRGPE